VTIFNKKFWEELIAYFPITTNAVSASLRGCGVDTSDEMEYAVEMATGSMIYIPNFMTIGSGIQVTLRLLPQQFELLQCWYY
jgi:hypothetical protein